MQSQTSTHPAGSRWKRMLTGTAILAATPTMLPAPAFASSPVSPQ